MTSAMKQLIINYSDYLLRLMKLCLNVLAIVCLHLIQNAAARLLTDTNLLTSVLAAYVPRLPAASELTVRCS